MKSLLDFKGDSGAAFVLRSPSKRSVSMPHADGLIEIRQNSPYATVQFQKSFPQDRLVSEAWRVVQEAFDIHAAVHREALAVCRGDVEYIAWGRDNGCYQITIGEVADMPWSMNAGGSTDEVAAIPQRINVAHHPAFRFYRLSQLSDDLFDAYRNAYLALECIVSSVSPKTSESELTWLKRVLGNNLSAAIPHGMDIDSTVTEIYKVGRNPIFHAKVNESFYSPQSNNRDLVQRLLETIHQILAWIFRAEFGFSGGWARFSQAAYDAQAKAVFQFQNVICRLDDKAEESTHCIQVFDCPRRFGNLWARVDLSPPVQLSHIDGIEIRNKGENWCNVDFQELLPMSQVNKITLELSIAAYNIRSPKPIHQM